MVASAGGGGPPRGASRSMSMPCVGAKAGSPPLVSFVVLPRATYWALHRTTYRRAIRDTGTQPEMPPPRAISDDFAMRLTDDELVQMRLEVMDVLDRWTAMSHDSTTADDREPRRFYYGVIMAALESDLFDTYQAQMEPNT
jgi:hypothetical protein